MRNFLFTSESVGEGHPDKICDQISDSILDAHLIQDQFSKVALETMVKSNTVILAGEITSQAKVNCNEIVRKVLKETGYDFDDEFDYKTVNILSFINKQSVDIAGAVGNNNRDMGAGDQGIMFGYATDETEEKMPITLVLAHNIVKKIKELKSSVSWIRPDCKSQVTVEYLENNGVLIPLRIDNIVLSCHHSKEIELEEMREFLIEKVVKEVIRESLSGTYNVNSDGERIGKNLLKEDTKFHIQSSGKFEIGGPKGDAGLTGRKIIVDTYGGFGAHGGGCFSGKDCSKVDRSGAYAARWIAKSLVCNNICRRVLVQISYAIGITKPLSVFVETYGTGKISNPEILQIIEDNFDLRPGAIVEELGLRKPLFRNTATFGHFGNENYPWEKPKQLKRTDSPGIEK